MCSLIITIHRYIYSSMLTGEYTFYLYLNNDDQRLILAPEILMTVKNSAPSQSTFDQTQSYHGLYNESL